MEALDFLKKYTRMCAECKDCYGCPLTETTCAGYCELSEKQIINVINKTEQWSKEHPLVTNEMKIREVFGAKAVYAISSLNAQTLKDWLDEPYNYHCSGGRNPKDGET